MPVFAGFAELLEARIRIGRVHRTRGRRAGLFSNILHQQNGMGFASRSTSDQIPKPNWGVSSASPTRTG